MLLHRGMAQDCPLIEMAIRYLLRSETEWKRRQQASKLLHDIVPALHAGSVRAIDADTVELRWAAWNHHPFGEQSSPRDSDRGGTCFGPAFWGLGLLGGRAGGGGLHFRSRQ